MSHATMTRSPAEHATVELLSAYLDRELPGDDARDLETHLTDCDVCHRRLEGLRRAAAGLQGLKKLDPPPGLEQMVVRRIALEGPRTNWGDRIETIFSGFQRQSSFLAIFAVVLALAVIAVLFAQAMHRRQNEVATIPVIINGESPDGQVRFYQEVGERRMYKVEGGWIEGEVDRESVSRALVRDSAESIEFFNLHPHLQPLRDLPGQVIFAVDGEVIELRTE